MVLAYVGRLLLITVLSVGPTSAAFGAIVYDEAGSGDLADTGLSPTAVGLSEGSNEVRGTVGSAIEAGVRVFDRDYFAVTVPDGFELLSVVQLPGTLTAGLAFFAVQLGTQVTVSPTPSDATGLLGWVHYSSATLNSDLLPLMGVPNFGSTGFTPPLGPGDYAFWVQELGLGSFPFRFDFVLAQVPMPASATLLLAGLAVIGLARRRRRTT